MPDQEDLQIDVAIILGSDSDLPVMAKAVEVLEKFEISHEVKVLSAHRTPDLLREYLGALSRRETKVIIAAAGKAAHLAGNIAAATTLPVIGVPMDGGLGGLDALLSTVQMPGGIPVLTVAVGKAGATNAALAAAQILALQNRELAQALDAYRRDMVKDIVEKNAELQRLGVKEYVRAKTAHG